MGSLRRLAWIALIGLGCGPSSGSTDDDGDNGNNGVDGGGGTNGGADAGSCGAQQENIEIINLGPPPDMLIVLDRSGSMLEAATLFPPFGPSKWSIMKNALQGITEDYDQKIRFGMSVFPTDNACGVAPGAAVGIAIDNAGPIASAMAVAPSNEALTPAHLALTEALAIYESIPVNPDGRFVLFATDGIPNCGGNPPSNEVATNAETLAAVENLADAGIKTFVLGFGQIFGLDTQLLNDAALAGGVPKPGGPPHYYQASNATELEQALNEIAGGIIVPSCSFALTEEPSDPDLVTVTMDGTAVPRDASHQDGWDYYPDSSTITFFGGYCSMIEVGSSSEVEFLYGCAGPVIE